MSNVDARSFAIKLDRIREDMQRTATDLDELKATLLPASDAIARFDEWVDSMAAVYLSRVYNDVSAAFSPDTHPSAIRVGRIAVTPGAVPETNFAPTLAFILGDLLKEKHRAIFESRLSDAPAMAERPAMIAELKNRIRKLELDEERVIRAAEAAGHVLARRANVDIDLVLRDVLPTE
jgi:hypothetical protein